MLHPDLLILQLSRAWCEGDRMLWQFFERCIGHNLGIPASYGESVTDALYERAAQLYSTSCERGFARSAGQPIPRGDSAHNVA